MKSCPQKLCDLVDKKYLLFTERGNTAIKQILSVLKTKDYKTVLIQDQGGWLTYPQYIEKLKFEKIELKTDYGLVDPTGLDNYKNAILLINSMPGYSSLQDMEEIESACKKNNILLVNDVSGSIGTQEAKYGEIIFGSFGNAKPIDIGSGAFIATDDAEIYKLLSELVIFNVDDDFLDNLDKKLSLLAERLSYLQIRRNQVIDELSSFDIVHKDGFGINVIVKFNDDNDKDEIINYCNDNDLEYTLCPRYIRINENAISIEIKRLHENHDMDIDETYDEVDE